jgi:hypothetical protein
MPFHKTSIAVDTRVVPASEARDLASKKHPPQDPEIGQVWDGMVWDGGAWVTHEVFQKGRSQLPSEA